MVRVEKITGLRDLSLQRFRDARILQVEAAGGVDGLKDQQQRLARSIRSAIACSYW
jgi:hypothetical protein